MKKSILFILAIVLLMSCDVFDDYMSDGGITFDVVNRTKKEFQDAKFYIGKYNDNTFTPTDSLIENTIIRANSSNRFGTNEKGWQPNLNKIKPEKGKFLIKLSDGRQYYFGEFDFPNPTLEGVNFNIYIEDDKIYWPG
jgi:hypothetical protein